MVFLISSSVYLALLHSYEAVVVEMQVLAFFLFLSSRNLVRLGRLSTYITGKDMRTVRFGYRRRSHVLRALAVENSRGCKTGIGLEMRKRRDHGPDCWGRHLPARRRCCSAREDAWKKSVYLYFLSQLVSHICAIRGREPYDYKEGQCPAVRVASVNEPSPEWPKIVPLKHRHACFATFPTVEEGTRSYLCMLTLISRALRQLLWLTFGTVCHTEGR